VPDEIDVELRGRGKGVGAGDRREIGVTEFELDCAGVQAVFAQAAGDLFGEMGECGFELGGVLRVGVEGVLVADGFRVAALADLGIEPASGVEALSGCQEINRTSL